MIATANNLFVGRAAFIAAAHFYRGRRITFQQGAFVIRDSKDRPIPEQMSAADFLALYDAEMNLGLPARPDTPEGE